MRLACFYSHEGGVDEVRKAGLFDWVACLFEKPGIEVGEAQTSAIRNYLRTQLEADGWAINVRIDAESNLTVFARKSDLVFQLQTGNICRYAYDLLKLQHLYIKNEIKVAILAVPTKIAAREIGSNVTNLDRVQNELELFSHFITIPIMVISFE